jgi:hypothetical protein
LSFVKPTPAIVAALTAYTAMRLKQTPLLHNESRQDAELTNPTISLKTFPDIQTASKAFIAAHSPSPLHQLEAFKVHRDHQKLTALELLNEAVNEEDQLSTPKSNSVTKKHNISLLHHQTAEDSTDFTLMTPTTTLELEIDLLLEEIQNGEEKALYQPQQGGKPDNSLQLDELTQGQYPYPLTLTLSKTSSLNVHYGKNKTDLKINDPLMYPSFDDNNTTNDKTEWFPNRLDLIADYSLQNSENNNSQPNHNIVELVEKASTIRIDSHINTHDSIYTLFLVIQSIGSKLEQSQNFVNDENNHQNIPMMRFFQEKSVQLEQRLKQGRFLLNLFSKQPQHASYTSLVREHIEELDKFSSLSLGDQNEQFEKKDQSFSRSPTTSPTASPDYFPVPFYQNHSHAESEKRSDQNDETTPQKQTNKSHASFSFQAYHNTLTKSCLDAVKSTLSRLPSPQGQETQPLLFLLQENRTLTAKEALAFELFLNSLD